MYNNTMSVLAGALEAMVDEAEKSGVAITFAVAIAAAAMSSRQASMRRSDCFGVARVLCVAVPGYVVVSSKILRTVSPTLVST